MRNPSDLQTSFQHQVRNREARSGRLFVIALLAIVLAGPYVLGEASSGNLRHETTIRMTGRVDRVYTDQFFTVNDRRAGSDLPVFIPNPTSPPLRGDLVTVSGTMHPADFATWVGANRWYTEGWGLLTSMLTKFDDRAVLVADTVIDQTGRNLVAAPGVHGPERPVLARTRGERKRLAQAGTAASDGAAAVGGAGMATGGAGGATGTGAAATAGSSGTRGPKPGTSPIERVTPAGNQPDRRTGESAGELSERGTGAGAGGASTTGETRTMGAGSPRDQAGGTAATGESPGTPGGPGGQASTAVPGGLRPGEQLVPIPDVIGAPQRYAGAPLVLEGVVLRQTDPRVVEIVSTDGPDAGVVRVILDQDLSTVPAGQRVFVRGRITDEAAGRASAGSRAAPLALSGEILTGEAAVPAQAGAARPAETPAAQGAAGQPPSLANPPPANPAMDEVIAATATAIARDVSLFNGRRVSLVGEVAEVLGPHAFLVRDGGASSSLRSAATTSPEDSVIVLVSDPGAMPERVGQPVRVFGRVSTLEEPRASDSGNGAQAGGGRIDPAWLEGVDLTVFGGRPVIMADSVTDPDTRPIGSGGTPGSRPGRSR